MGRFFPKPPRKGQPISARGTAEGLAGIDHALSNMAVTDGQINWSAHDVPTITLNIDSLLNFLGSLATITNPGHVLAKKTESGTTAYGWVATVTHASQHPA